MRALRRPRHVVEHDEAEDFGIPLAPLVDIVFLLLVFFLIATTYLDEEKDLTLALPKVTVEPGAAPRLERVLLNIRADGTVLLGNRPVDRDDLYRALVEARRANPHVPVILRGDRAAAHGEIVRVLSLCQRARILFVAVAVEPKPRKEGREP